MSQDEPNYVGRAIGWIVGIIAAVLVVFFLGALLFAWPLEKTPRDKIGLSYGGGIVEGAHFQKIYEPGHSTFFNGWGDKLYEYPVTQRNYIVSMRENEGDRDEKDSIEAVTSDNVRVNYETFTGFKLNTDDLRKFHETLGLKFHAWKNGGWNDLLDQTLRQVQENALQRITRQYTAKDLRSSTGTLEKVQSAVSRDLNERIIDVLGGNYFCETDWQPGQPCGDMQFVIKKVSVPKDIANSYEHNASSLIDVQTAANKAKAAEQQRIEILTLNDALSKTGGAYPLLKAVESGKVTFWVLNGDQQLTLPANPNGAK